MITNTKIALVLCISIIGGSAFLAPNSKGADLDLKTVEYQSAVNLYPEVDDSTTTGFGEPPMWHDVPPTIAGRDSLVSEALEHVWEYLKECGTGVQFCNIPQRDKYNKGPDTCFIAYTGRFKVNYVPIQREFHTYGRSTSSGVKKVYDFGRKVGGLGPDDHPHRWDIREHFSSQIEIFPELFEAGRLFMDSEKDSEEGPWAQSALEAVEFVILHELGHYESYVSTHCKAASLFQVKDSEEQANTFASSVLRCR